MKQKQGALDRVDKQEPTLFICKDMFSADSDLSLFTGLKIVHEQSGTEGILEGAFGQGAEKFKVRFPQDIKVKLDAKGNVKGGERITLYFKKFNFEQSKKILQ